MQGCLKSCELVGLTNQGGLDMAKMRLELTKTEIEYLYNLVSRSIDSGSYYGNSTQYYARQKRMKKAILDVLCPLPEARAEKEKTIRGTSRGGCEDGS